MMKFKFFVAAVLFIAAGFYFSGLIAENEELKFTKEFDTKSCTFKDEGQNAYFILKPGYQLVLEGEEDGKTVRFLMSVLDETKDLNVPGLGTVTTRVIEEKEWADGKPVEFARSFFAICDQTQDLYDFGDEVDIFNEDGTVSHDGTWHAGEPDKSGIAKPGIFMPGTFLLGSRYFQQLADGQSMERVENMEMNLTVKTDAGTFEGCVLVLESNLTETGAATAKTHCRDIGLVGEDDLKLIKYGYNVVDENGQ